MSKDCMFLDEWKHCDICEKLIKTKEGANGKKREHLLTEEDLRCDFYKDCYYKQKEKYKNALKEIKGIVLSTLDCGEWIGQGDNKMEAILQKISEVLNA